jgi:hypothetical protein
MQLSNQWTDKIIWDEYLYNNIEDGDVISITDVQKYFGDKLTEGTIIEKYCIDIKYWIIW